MEKCMGKEKKSNKEAATTEPERKEGG